MKNYSVGSDFPMKECAEMRTQTTGLGHAGQGSAGETTSSASQVPAKPSFGMLTKYELWELLVVKPQAHPGLILPPVRLYPDSQPVNALRLSLYWGNRRQGSGRLGEPSWGEPSIRFEIETRATTQDDSIGPRTKSDVIRAYK